MSILIDNCTFTYPKTEIGVFEVNIAADEGELVAVIGASGSGKTTMLKLVAGFEQPNQGRVFVNGQDMTNIPARLRNVGVVFQSYALFPLMSCADNVAYPLKIRGADSKARRKAALDMLDRVGLSSFANRFPGSMSGGQQQRVALARALVFNPSVLLLDEPLSALDAGLRVELRNEIRSLQKELKISALHVTHDQEEALSMADKVALMHHGRLIQIASPQEIYDAPISKRVAAFVGHANLWDATISGQDKVKVSFGELKCSTTGYGEGDEVTVLVRPEHVCTEPETEINTFKGHLSEDVFLGAVRRYAFSPSGGGEAVKGETSGRSSIAKISILPESIRLLPYEAEN